MCLRTNHYINKNTEFSRTIGRGLIRMPDGRIKFSWGWKCMKLYSDKFMWAMLLSEITKCKLCPHKKKMFLQYCDRCLFPIHFVCCLWSCQCNLEQRSFSSYEPDLTSTLWFMSNILFNGARRNLIRDK